MRAIRRRSCLAALGGATASALLGELAEAQPTRPAPPRPAAAPLAIVGGELRRPGQAPLKDSVVRIEGGRVRYLGHDRARVTGAAQLDARGKIVTGGLVDLLTQIGIDEVDLEPSTRDDALASDDPVRAAFRAADGYDPASSLIAIARTGGLCSAGVIPSGGLVSGQSAWADLDGRLAREALARPSLALHVVLDDGAYGSLGQSRGTALLRLRELLDDARLYGKSRAAYDGRRLRKLGASRLDLQVVLRALSGELPVIFHVDRASDIIGAIELGRARGLRTVIASAAEGWKVAPELAKAKVPAIVYPFDEGPRSFAALGAREDNAALLHRAGVTVALSVGDSHNARKLRQAAGNAVRAGLPAAAALDAITDAPARIVGMDRDHGAPALGRFANLAVWSADPFELSTRLQALFIRGRRVSLRTRQTALLERYR